MTGAEKTLKWYKEFVKTNGVYPLIKEVESQLEMAVEEEQVNKNESISPVIRCEHKKKKWIPQIAETYCPNCREIL